MAHAVACADAALLLRLYSTHALASQAQPAVVQARSRASGAHTHSHTHAHTHTHTLAHKGIAIQKAFSLSAAEYGRTNIQI